MSDIPNFNADPELEEKLDEDPTALEEQTLIDVQLYKSKKLQARRDAGESRENPEWAMLYPGDFADGSAPSTNGGGAEAVPETETEESDSEEATSAPSDDRTETTESTTADDSDGMMDYYHNLKDDYDIVEDGTGSSSPGTTESESDGSQDESSTEDESASEESTERVTSGVAPSTESPSLDRDFVQDRIRTLEDRLDEYHRQTLELKDEVAELREENARLQERLEE
jgi:hypothetical protein